MELSQEIQAFLYAAHSRSVARIAPATHFPISHASHRRHGYRRKGYRVCMVGAAGRNDAPFQSYRHRVYPLKDTPAHLYPHQYLAHLGFLHQTNEAPDEVLRYQVDGRPPATH